MLKRRDFAVTYNNIFMIYDLIIIGAGPAGITASIYASRFKINHLVIGEIPGGLITEAHSVCNFPGDNKINGFDLMQKMQGHAKELGAEIKEMERVVEIKKEGDEFSLKTESGQNFLAKNILLATGTKHRKLGLVEEDKYLGKGLAYCATCDAMFFRDKIVAVVGGGNSAMTAALYLAEVAQKVYLLVKGDELNGEMVWAEQIEKNPKIEVKYQTEVIKLKGDNKLEGIDLKNSNAEIEELILDGLFVEIGTQPELLLSAQLGLETERGYIKVDIAQKTNVLGVWAAGDITTNSNSVRQVITACSEGAVATQDIFTVLQKNK